MSDFNINKNTSLETIRFAGEEGIDQREALTEETGGISGFFDLHLAEMQAASALRAAKEDEGFSAKANLDFLKKCLTEKLSGSTFFVPEKTIEANNLATADQVKAIEPNEEVRQVRKTAYKYLKKQLAKAQAEAVNAENNQVDEMTMVETMKTIELDFLRLEGYTREQDAEVFEAVLAKYDLMALKKEQDTDSDSYKHHIANLENYYAKNKRALKAYRTKTNKEDALKSLERYRKDYEKISGEPMESKEELAGKSRSEILLKYKSVKRLFDARERVKAQSKEKQSDIQTRIDEKTQALQDLHHVKNIVDAAKVVDDRVEKGRALSAQLLGNKKLGGDSKEMVELKASLEHIETLLEKEDFDIKTDVEALSNAYQMTIIRCKDYLDTKSPTFFSGKKRYSMVKKTHERLLIERKKIELARRLIEEAEKEAAGGDMTNMLNRTLSVQGKTIRGNKLEKGSDILKIGALGVMSANEYFNDQTSKNPGDPLSLNLDDFRNLIGESNLGSVIFADGKMQIVNDGWFAQTSLHNMCKLLFGKDEKPTVENNQMRNRLYELIVQQIGDVRDQNPRVVQERKDFLKEAADRLGIGAAKAYSLSRKTIVDLIDRMYALSRYDERIAGRINEYSGDITGRQNRLISVNSAYVRFWMDKKLELRELPENEKDKEKKAQELKAGMKDVFKNAKKFSIEEPALTDVQWKRFTGTEFIDIQNRVLAQMERILEYSYRLNGNNNFDAVKQSAVLENDNTIDKLLIYVVNIEAAQTEEKKKAAEDELEAFVRSVAVNAVDQANLQGVKAEDIVNLRDSYIESNGSNGLEETIERKLLKSKTWKGNQTKLNRGKDALKELIDSMAEVSRLSSVALQEGLSTQEAEKMTSLGAAIQTLMDNKLEDMEYVTAELSGTVFVTELARAKKLHQGNYFAQTTQKLSELSVDERKQDKVEKVVEPNLITKMSRLNASQTKVVKFLLFEETGATLIEKPKDKNAKSLIQLKDELRKLPSNVACDLSVNVAGVDVCFRQKADNGLAIQIGNELIPLSRTAQQYSNVIEEEMMAHVELFGEEFARTYVENMQVDGDDLDMGVLIRSRNMCIRFLTFKTGKADSFFTNVTSQDIKMYALNLLNKVQTSEAVINQIIQTEVQLSNQITTQEMQELLASYEKQGKKSSVKKVEMLKQNRNEGADSVNWTSAEQKVVDFLSDLIYASDTTITDRSLTTADRIKAVMSAHSDTVFLLVLDEKLLDSVLTKLPFDMGNTTENLKKQFKDIRENIIVDKKDSKKSKKDELKLSKSQVDMVTKVVQYRAGLLDESKLDPVEKLGMKVGSGFVGMAKGRFTDFINDKSNADIFSEIAEQMDSGISGMEDELQEKLSNATSILFPPEEKKEQEVSPEMQMIQTLTKEECVERFKQELKIKNLTEWSKEINSSIRSWERQNAEQVAKESAAERQKRRTEVLELNLNLRATKEANNKYIELSRERLNSISAEIMKGDQGQGAFMKHVFNNYFTMAEKQAKLSMIASALRYSKPKTEINPPENLTEKEKAEFIQKEEMKTQAKYLGGFLKGAGPLMHKMMQGLPAAESLPKEIREAIDDMKSRLAPIPDHMVKAQMANIIDRSEGKITKIDIVKPFGAASVGQTFLCRIYGPNLEAEGREQVIKLLRPNVRNDMMREKKIMINCARLTDGTDRLPDDNYEMGGMEATYRGMLETIERELNLVLEGNNAQIAQGKYEGLYETVHSMKTSSLIEPTPTVMALERAPGVTIDSYLKSIDEEEKELLKDLVETGENGELLMTPQGDYQWKPITPEFIEKYYKLSERLPQMYEQLAKRQKFVSSLAQNWVTEGIFGSGFYHGDLHAGNIMIDDNAVTLIDFGNATDMTEVQTQHITKMIMAATAGSVDVFMESFHALLKNTKEEKYIEKKDELKQILTEIFSMGDVHDVGQRIVTALLKAQTLNLELPAEIFNFSQSQIRLQNTMKSMNSKMEDLYQKMERYRNILKDKASMSEADMKCDIFAKELAATKIESGDRIPNANAMKYKKKFVGNYTGDPEEIVKDVQIYSAGDFKTKYGLNSASSDWNQMNKTLNELQLLRYPADFEHMKVEFKEIFDFEIQKAKKLINDKAGAEKLDKLVEQANSCYDQEGKSDVMYKILKEMNQFMDEHEATKNLSEKEKPYFTAANRKYMYFKTETARDEGRINNLSENVLDALRDNILDENVSEKIKALKALIDEDPLANREKIKNDALEIAMSMESFKFADIMKQIETEKSKLNPDKAVISELGVQLSHNHREWFKKRLLMDTNLKDVKEALLSTEEAYMTAMENNVNITCRVVEEMEPQKAELAEHIRESFERVKALKKKENFDPANMSPEMKDAVSEYLLYYRQAAYMRIDRAEKLFTAEIRKEKADEFEDVMSRVVEANTSAALKKIGIMTVYKMADDLRKAGIDPSMT